MPMLRTMLAPLAAACLAVPVTAGEPPAPADQALLATIWLRPGLGLVDQAAPALLILPSGWAAGDAIAVLVPGGTGRGTRGGLVAALLDAGAAVLEIGGHRPEAPDLAAALEVGQRDLGAGILVAIGDGEADAALLAAEEARSATGGRYAAVARLEPAAPLIRFAAAPEAEDWPRRAPLFCLVLASATPHAGRGALAAACQDGLGRLP